MSTQGPITKLSAENQGLETLANGGLTRRLGLKIAKIVKVYPDKNEADVEWLWPIRGGQSGMPLSKPYIGLRSGIHFIPEIGSIVIVGYSGDEALMLSYLPPSDFDKLLSGQRDKNNVPSKIRKVQPGEMSFYSSKSAEIYLSEKIQLTDSASNQIVVDPAFGITFKSVNLKATNEAGNLTMGTVIRNSSGEEKIITDDGLDVNNLVGGNALNEFALGIKEKSDGSNLATDFESEPFINTIIGTYINDNGQKVLDQINEEIAISINMDPAALLPIVIPGSLGILDTKIQVDKAGNININQGNMLTPTEAPTVEATPAPEGSTKQTSIPYVNQSKQRAAREGDRVTIPISPIQTDLDHPQLAIKGAVNSIAITGWVPSSFLCMGIPVVYVPAVAPTKLVGEITQGANGVFIGSQGPTGKANEKLETVNNN